MSRKIRLLGVATSVVLALTLLFVGITWAAHGVGFVVDSFDTSTQNLTVNSSSPTDSESVDDPGAGPPYPDILGGERDSVLTYTSGSFSIVLNINDIGSELLEYRAQAGVKGQAQVTWDGDDNAPLALDTSGLGGVDLTDSGTKDGFHLRILSQDQPVDITMRVYSGTNWSEEILSLTVSELSPMSYFLPFSDFGPGQGVISYTSVGAVELFLDGTVGAGAQDLILTFIETNARDFGDLPDTYSNTLLTDDGARHIIGSLYLGSSVDGEGDGTESANADADDTDGSDDEDGVTPTGNWSDGDGDVDVVSTGRGCLMGWLDFTDGTISGWDGDFNDSLSGVSEVVINNRPVVTGTNAITFTLPTGVADDEPTFYARFRLVPDEDNDGDCEEQTAVGLTGEEYNGETEDYKWTFGPTAITLSDLTARSVPRTVTPLLVVSLVGLGVIVILTLARRRKA